MNQLAKLNLALVILPVMIFSLGYFTLLASSQSRAIDQLLFFCVGILLYILFTYIDPIIYKLFWVYAYTGTMLLLGSLFILGVAKLGSIRWLNIAGLSLQPSEIAKLVLIITLASYICLHPDFTKSWKKLGTLLLLYIPLVLLVFLQPDLGTSLVLTAILVFVLFYAGINKLYFIISLIAIGLLSNPIWNLLKDYQKIRVLVFLNPQMDVLGHGYNVIQSLISIGSGGIVGKGFGKGTQTQMNFLPVHWTDFIFASFSEEWGFIGVILLFVLYLLLFIAILLTIRKSNNAFYTLVSVGVFAMFFTQFFVNVGMNLGLMPVTGITLPLISYGGSSMLVSMSMLGLLQGIWVHSQSQV